MPLFPIPDRMSQIERLKMVRIQMFNQLLTGLNYEESPQELPEQIKLHKYLCQCYFEYIRKIVRDFVPKRISHKMINSFIKDLDKRLNEEIFQTCLREENIGEILSEHESIEKNRKDIEIKLGAIKSAIKTMVDIQYF
uniref:GED domain-containing protein n=1 Tax=Schizaphis graminum TaxID=13262 RepID=A0A2S2NZJ5_SCHGA